MSPSFCSCIAPSASTLDGNAICSDCGMLLANPKQDKPQKSFDEEEQQCAVEEFCACRFPSVHILGGSPFCDSCGLPLTNFDLVLKTIASRSCKDSHKSGEIHTCLANSRNYKYTPLDDQQIRLMVLHPGAFVDPVHCTIIRADIQHHPQFEAVSYTWAGEDGNSALCRYIKCGRAQKLLSVTANCEAALRRLRLQSFKRVLWMDAICIDQESTNERNHQVRLMSKIYSLAQRVLVYLGEEDGNSDLVFNFMNNQGRNASATPRLALDNPVRKLLCRPWFHRIWVLQEVAVARRAVAICGPYTMPLEALSVHNLNLVRLPQESADGTVPCVLRLQLGPHDEQRRLWNLLRSSRSCACKDPRDKVFALRGLANDIPPEDLNPDYSKSTTEVYTEVTEYLIMKYRTLDVIDLFSIENRSLPDLPSWVPDWSTTESIGPHVYWAPNGNSKTFRKDIVKVYPGLPAPLYARLEVYAVRLDRIRCMKHISSLQLESFPRYETDLVRHVEIFGWHAVMTRIFGDDIEHCPTPDIIKCICENWSPLPSTPDQCSWCYNKFATYRKFLEKSVHQNPVFLTEGGSIGLGPERAQPGDVICSMLGTSFLTILTPFRDGFKYVGRCHVMDFDNMTPIDVTKQDGTVDTSSLVAWCRCQKQPQRMEYEPVSIY